MLESQLHLVSAILILLAAVVPVYLTVRLRDNLRKLVLVLTIFILVHAVYHIVGFFGLTILAEGVFEPLSVAILIFFGIVYSGMTRPKYLGAKNSTVVAWTPSTLLLLMDNITTTLLMVALGIFVWLAVLSKNIRILWDSGIISLSALQGDVGLEIHVVSMFFFSMLLWVRFYYSQRSGRRMIEGVDATL
jgi:hypothetical protein